MTGEGLRTWRGSNSQPFLHFVALANTLGCIFAATFLLTLLPEDEDEDGGGSGGSGGGGWNFLGLSGVEAYFPALGAATLLSSCPGLSYFALRKPGGGDGGGQRCCSDDHPLVMTPTVWLLLLAYNAAAFCQVWWPPPTQKMRKPFAHFFFF